MKHSKKIQLTLKKIYNLTVQEDWKNKDWWLKHIYVICKHKEINWNNIKIKIKIKIVKNYHFSFEM